MTFDAPRHVQRLDFGNPVHGFHGAVTLLTLEICLDMPLVREMHEVRNVVDFYPRNRFLSLPVTENLHDFWPVPHTGYLGMTARTTIHTGHARTGRAAGIDVAILTGNFIFPRMNAVTEFDGLNGARV